MTYRPTFRAKALGLSLVLVVPPVLVAADEKPRPPRQPARVYTNEDLDRVHPFAAETGGSSVPAVAADEASPARPAPDSPQGERRGALARRSGARARAAAGARRAGGRAAFADRRALEPERGLRPAPLVRRQDFRGCAPGIARGGRAAGAAHPGGSRGARPARRGVARLAAITRRIRVRVPKQLTFVWRRRYKGSANESTSLDAVERKTLTASTGGAHGCRTQSFRSIRRHRSAGARSLAPGATGQRTRERRRARRERRRRAGRHGHAHQPGDEGHAHGHVRRRRQLQPERARGRLLRERGRSAASATSRCATSSSSPAPRSPRTSLSPPSSARRSP